MTWKIPLAGAALALFSHLACGSTVDGAVPHGDGGSGGAASGEAGRSSAQIASSSSSTQSAGGQDCIQSCSQCQCQCGGTIVTTEFSNATGICSQTNGTPCRPAGGDAGGSGPGGAGGEGGAAGGGGAGPTYEDCVEINFIECCV